MGETLTATTADHAELAAIRARREALYQAIVGLEDALASPSGDSERWRLRVAMATEHAAARVDDHIHQTEAPKGLLTKIKDQEPRLSRKVAQLKVDHERLRTSLDALTQALAVIDEGELGSRAESIRDQAGELLTQLVRHRQRGADLIYEAFHVDIGESS